MGRPVGNLTFGNEPTPQLPQCPKPPVVDASVGAVSRVGVTSYNAHQARQPRERRGGLLTRFLIARAVHTDRSVDRPVTTGAGQRVPRPDGANGRNAVLGDPSGGWCPPRVQLSRSVSRERCPGAR